jgi:phosphomannomutase
MSKLMISSSGLRGIVGEHMTAHTLEPFVRAFLKWCPEGKIIVGGDTRTSHSAISQLVMSICQLCGRDVVYIGQVPTPTVQQMVRQTMAAGGFAITASHNPVPWNGIKMINSSGSFLSAEDFSSFDALYQTGQGSSYVPWDQQGQRFDDPDALKKHVELIEHVLPINKIKPLKVLIDVNHGAGCDADNALFNALDHVQVDYLYDTPDGRFSHAPEPLKENLKELCDRVANGGYDIGFAQDPDADRLVIVDEGGRFIGEDYSLAFCMDYYLSSVNVKHPSVVVNLSTSKIIEFIASKYNATLFQTKIGEPNVTAKMKAIDAVIGGEGNGGIICPAIGWGRDSLTGIVLALLHVSVTQKSVSEVIESYPKYVMVRDKQPLESSDGIKKKLAVVADRFSSENVNLDDGVKVTFESSWVHIRPSNTEPIIRIFAEAKSHDAAVKLIEEIKRL